MGPDGLWMQGGNSKHTKCRNKNDGLEEHSVFGEGQGSLVWLEQRITVVMQWKIQVSGL